jgi:DNA-binding winged helix-turn-helix (wHTH) protein
VTRYRAERYAFDDFVLDVAQRSLCRGGIPVPLAPTAFDVLVALVCHAGQLVTKRDLLAHVWPDTFVEDGILTVYVSLLRKALGDTTRAVRYIETVARFGYRFIAPVVAPSQHEDVARQTSRRGEKAIGHVARGRERLLNGSCFALRDAVDAFQSAIRLDGMDASAYAGFAMARCAQAQNLAAHPRRAYRDATRSVLRALALHQGDPSVQVALGTVLWLREWDWVGAERAVRSALENDVENVDAHVLCGNLLEAHGDTDSALEMKMRALEYAPTSPFVLTQIALLFFHRRNYEHAIAWTQRALAQDPAHAAARMCLAWALWKIGRYDAVTAELVTQAESFGITRETLLRASADGARAPYADGWPSPFTRVVMAQLPTAAGGPSVVNAAIASGERRETELAFQYLNQAIARRDPCLVYLAVDPQWDSLRADPRFHDALKYIGLPHPSL